MVLVVRMNVVVLVLHLLDVLGETVHIMVVHLVG